MADRGDQSWGSILLYITTQIARHQGERMNAFCLALRSDARASVHWASSFDGQRRDWFELNGARISPVWSVECDPATATIHVVEEW